MSHERHQSQSTVSRAERLAESALGESMIELSDIAAFCNVTYRTAQAWRAQGLLPPPDFALGKVIRWRRGTIERFIADRSEAVA